MRLNSQTSLTIAFAVLAGLGSATPAFAEGDAQPTEFTSPYFVDGVHCEGFDLPKLEANWLIPKDSVDQANKTRDQKLCEVVFDHFGIKKFTWITPEDLEAFSAKIKSSSDYKSANVSLKKSQLPNHVHVMLNATPRKGVTVSVNARHDSYAAGDAGSGRTTTAVGGVVEFRQQAPMAVHRLHVNAEQTQAADALALTQKRPSKSDAVTIGDRDRRLLDLRYELETSGALFSQPMQSVMSVQSVTSLVNGKDAEKDTLRAEAQMRINYGITFTQDVVGQGVVTWTPMVVAAEPTVTSIDTDTDDDKTADNSDDQPTEFSARYVVLPGLRLGFLFGRDNVDFMRFDASLLREVTTGATVGQSNLVLQGTFPRLFGLYGSLGISERQVRNPVLVEDQFYLGDRNEFGSWIAAGRVFGSPQRLHDVRLIAGMESVDYRGVRNGDQPKVTYGGIAYRMTGETLAVNLGVNVYSGRTY